MSRLNKKFHQLTAEDKKAFIPFIMAGFPNIKYSRNLLHKLPSLGADIIEIGMPFTDPMADGKIIQDAGHEVELFVVTPDTPLDEYIGLYIKFIVEST